MGVCVVVDPVVQPPVMIWDRAVESRNQVHANVGIVVLVHDDPRSCVQDHDLAETILYPRLAHDLTHLRRDIDTLLGPRRADCEDFRHRGFLLWYRTLKTAAAGVRLRLDPSDTNS